MLLSRVLRRIISFWSLLLFMSCVIVHALCSCYLFLLLLLLRFVVIVPCSYYLLLLLLLFLDIVMSPALCSC